MLDVLCLMFDVIFCSTVQLLNCSNYPLNPIRYVLIIKSAQVLFLLAPKKGKFMAKKSKKIKICGKYSKIIKNFKKTYKSLFLLML